MKKEVLKPANSTISDKNRYRERIAIFIFGIVFFFIVILFALFKPDPTVTQWFIFRVVLAIAAAGIAVLIPGLLSIEIESKIKVGGAIAVFVLVFWFNPPLLEENKPTSSQIATGENSPVISNTTGSVKIIINSSDSAKDNNK